MPRIVDFFSPLLLPLLLVIAGCNRDTPARSATVQQTSTPVGSQLRIALQPLGFTNQEVLEYVRKAIASTYMAEVILLPSIPLPPHAFTPPRSRYRADTLLRFLDTAVASKYDKVLGLTNRDISTTKGTVADWGVLGLGSLGGRTCVISTFRMRRNRAGKQTFQHRLMAVSIHELGHTFGLPHCAASGCFMQDAEGTIARIDQETYFCPQCQQRLPLVK